MNLFASTKSSKAIYLKAGICVFISCVSFLFFNSMFLGDFFQTDFGLSVLGPLSDKWRMFTVKYFPKWV